MQSSSNLGEKKEEENKQNKVRRKYKCLCGKEYLSRSGIRTHKLKYKCNEKNKENTKKNVLKAQYIP